MTNTRCSFGIMEGVLGFQMIGAIPIGVGSRLFERTNANDTAHFNEEVDWKAKEAFGRFIVELTELATA